LGTRKRPPVVHIVQEKTKAVEVATRLLHLRPHCPVYSLSPSRSVLYFGVNAWKRVSGYNEGTSASKKEKPNAKRAQTHDLEL